MHVFVDHSNGLWVQSCRVAELQNQRKTDRRTRAEVEEQAPAAEALWLALISSICGTGVASSSPPLRLPFLHPTYYLTYSGTDTEHLHKPLR